MTEHTHPLRLVSAIYRPRMPAGSIPDGEWIPWIGVRSTWLPMGGLAFGLVGGSDGFGLVEGEVVHPPAIIALPADLRGIRPVVAGAGR